MGALVLVLIKWFVCVFICAPSPTPTPTPTPMGLGLGLRPLFSLLAFLISLSSSHSDEQPSESCNLFEGSWVLDGGADPLYDAGACPLVAAGLNCQKLGRPDNMYLHYRWQPTHCDIPRFEGKELMEMYRGKKIMFVGDSLSRNQWESMGCMLLAAVPTNYTLSSRGPLTTLSFPEYDFSLKLLKNGFLVSLTNRTIKLDTLAAPHLWEDHHVLIFNTYHWWLHSGHLRMWDTYQIGNQTFEDMDVMQAYKTALTTWANWLDSNIDPTQTRVFFQGISPVHYRGEEWNEPQVHNCKGQTKPVEGSTYPGTKPRGDAVVRSVLGNMTKPALLFDILLLSQLRKDGHPSIYAQGGLDCSHWCLAGVPDTWNQLLYTILLQT